MAPKRILVITTFYKPFIGGAEISTEEFIGRLKNEFYFVVITARIDRSLPKKELDGEIVIYRLGFGFYFDKYLFPILAFVKSFSIDFDCSYAVMATYSGMAALLIKFFRNKPYVLNLQSGTLIEKLKSKKFFLVRLVCKQIHARADYVQAISRALYNSALELGADSERISIVPNGVFIGDFKPTFKGYKRRIIAVSRLERVKGVKYLIGAMPKVLSKFPDAELWIAGDGSEREDVSTLVKYLGVENSVKVLGKIQRSGIPQLLNSGEIFVMASLAEGLGVACLEAMACGLAVVATRVDGILDIVKDKQTGLLANPSDSYDLAEKIIDLLSDEEKRKLLSANGFDFVQDYDWDKISVKLSGIFNRVEI